MDVCALQSRYVPMLPALLGNPASDDADLVDAIEPGLAEMSDGIRTEDEFRALLTDTVERLTADIPS